jgi:succinate dehydrogenase flavin-adding protein (antitoxin of CptAB toxin-antitoxin module)
MKSDSPLIIHVSFKNELSDINLYNWVINHSNKSGFVKDILRQAMIEELNKNSKN